MKYRCQVCRMSVEAKDVIGHAAQHVEVRAKAVCAEIYKLPAADRVTRVLAMFCGVCGFAAPEHADGCERLTAMAAVATIECELREHDNEYHHLTRPSAFQALGVLKSMFAVRP